MKCRSCKGSVMREGKTYWSSFEHRMKRPIRSLRTDGSNDSGVVLLADHFLESYLRVAGHEIAFDAVGIGEAAVVLGAEGGERAGRD